MSERITIRATPEQAWAIVDAIQQFMCYECRRAVDEGRACCPTCQQLAHIWIQIHAQDPVARGGAGSAAGSTGGTDDV